KFEFELLDTSKFKVTDPTEDQPFLIIRLLYSPNVKGTYMKRYD
ncbi:hypothetical protein chiPu_0026732, partial [Chiloscyllium punctatum]|nr:hypothetical protein [Chiloscyllium punctatum]